MRLRLWRWLGLTPLLVTQVAAGAGADESDFRPLSFPSLSKGKARTFSADFYVDNRDRDPHGADIFDAGFRFRQQVGDHTEIFANFVADRVVSIPDVPAVPPSPRDLIFVGPQRLVPSTFIGEHPYLDHRGNASFDAFIPGVATLGLTRAWLHDDGVSLGASAALVIPMAGSLNALRSGANSGTMDAVFAGLASRPLAGGTAHGRAALTLAGSGSQPDRSFSVSGNTVETLQTSVPIGNRVDLGLAWIRPLTGSVAGSIETRLSKEFVGAERFDAISPLDVLLGIHKAFGRWKFSAALLDHFRALKSGELRANPLAGAIDLSNVSMLDRNAFLARAGLGAVAGKIRDDAHIVLIGSSATALPAGATRIPATYVIRSEHNLGYVFTVSFRR